MPLTATPPALKPRSRTTSTNTEGAGSIPSSKSTSAASSVRSSPVSGGPPAPPQRSESSGDASLQRNKARALTEHPQHQSDDDAEDTDNNGSDGGAAAADAESSRRQLAADQMRAHKKVLSLQQQQEPQSGSAGGSGGGLGLPSAPRHRGGTLRQVGSWKQALTPEGVPYWWNTETNETQWEPPADALHRPSVRNEESVRKAALRAAQMASNASPQRDVKSPLLKVNSVSLLEGEGEETQEQEQGAVEATDAAVGVSDKSGPPSQPPDTSDKRIAILEEIWDTEKHYVEDLEVMVNLYLLPLRDSLKNRQEIIDPKKIPELFSNVEQLLAVNQELLSQLEILIDSAAGVQRQQNTLADVLQNADVSVVDDFAEKTAAIFIKISKDLRAYAKYCNNHEEAMAVYNSISQHPPYRSYEDLTRKNTGNLRLDSFISKPVQRLLKYPLFLKDLRRQTCSLHSVPVPAASGAEEPAKTGHSTVDQLSSALHKIEAVATFMNNEKAKKENLEKLTEIRLSHVNAPLKLKDSQFIAESRIFHLEALLLKNSSKGKFQARMVFLFSDCLMYSSVKSSHGRMYEFKKSLPMHLIVCRRAPKDSKVVQKLSSKSGQKTIKKASNKKGLVFGNQSGRPGSPGSPGSMFSATVGPSSPRAFANAAAQAASEDEDTGAQAFQIRHIDKNVNRILTFVCGSAYQADVWSDTIQGIIAVHTAKQDQTSQLRKSMMMSDKWKDG